MTVVPLSISRVLGPALEYRPDAEALVGSHGSLTYQQLDRRASLMAGGLWERGVRSGDRIAVTMPNDIDIVVAFHATMRLGAIWVGVPAALADPEKKRILAHCRPRLYVTGSDPRRPALSATDYEVVDTATLADMEAAGHRAPAVRIDPHAPAGIAYTSGTTGTPKGVVHSQHNLLLPGAVLTAERGYGPDLRKADCLPFTILNLLVLGPLLAAQAGGCCVVVDRRDVSGIVEALRTHRATIWNGVPTQLHDLVHRPEVAPDALRGLDEIWCGGADLADELRCDFFAKFGLPIRATYGLTEAPTVIAIDPPNGTWRPECSGRSLPHVRVRSEDGELTVSPAATGPWAGQYTSMLGFWEGEGVSPHTGPLRTGDIGTVDEAGWIRVHGRRKTMIVRGGANIYPTEVERIITAVPGIAGAAVFGRADARLGERVTAVVEFTAATSLTAAELTSKCKTSLAAYKLPDAWFSIRGLPRNSMGKIDRTRLPSLLSTATRLDIPDHA